MSREENIVRVLRGQAWERAKGELYAVSLTFFGADSAREGQFQEYTEAIDDLIYRVEHNGLAE